VLSQAYMQNAFLAGGAIAVLTGIVGIFVVLRANSFAAHALSQISFAGASGAVLLGVEPLWGLVAFALFGAAGLGVLSVGEARRDAVTALVMTAALGTGALFLVLNNTYATSVFSLLFGSIVGISRPEVAGTFFLTAGVLALLGVIFRPLLFSTVNIDAARARGVPLGRLNSAFLVCLALAAAATIPIVGSLLVFALLVAPPAAATLLAKQPLQAVVFAVLLNLICCWGGITIAYYSTLPVGFIISMLSASTYLGARLYRRSVRA
jgi:zinc/manganese transport system permease protein